MSKQRVLLSQAVKAKTTPPPAAPAEDAPAPVARAAANPAKPIKPSRIGTRLLGFHVPDPVHRQFKVLAAEQGKNVNEILQEAINDVFQKYGKEPIA